MEELKKEFNKRFPKYDKNDFRCFADDLNGDTSGCVLDKEASCCGDICFYKDANNIYKKEDCKHYHLSNNPLYYPPEELWQFIEQNTVPKSEYKELKETLTHCEILLEAIKAENEKLRKDTDTFYKGYLALQEVVLKLKEADAEARKEERARIVEQINETAKKFYAINPLVLADEFVEAITADQLTQSDENIPTNLEPQPSEEKI